MRGHDRKGTLDPALGITDLTDLLERMLRHYDYFYIVIDAIDECPEKHRHEVLALLGGIYQNITDARLIYTSREEHDIKERLLKLQRVHIIAKTSDFELYVASEIQNSCSSGRLNLKRSEVKGKKLEQP